MPRYNVQRFDPPAPLVFVTLRTVDRSNRVSNVPMIIDSGADSTLLPASSIRQLALQLDPQRRCEVTAFDGSASNAPVVECELMLLGLVFRGHYPILDDEDGILGRDILNYFAIVLDGPALQWRVVTSVE